MRVAVVPSPSPYRDVDPDTIVPVSGEVAHTMKLGQREVERRKKRRAAAKRSRKQNRM